MSKNYTENHLLQLIYNETTPQETSDLCEMLQSDAELLDTFNDWNDTLNELDKSAVNPHPTSVALIMEYAAKLHETV